MLLDVKSEYKVSFYVRKMIFLSNYATINTPKVHSISETRIKYVFYKTEGGKVFTDNSGEGGVNTFSGVIVDNLGIDKFETSHPVDFFEQYSECEKYIRNYEPFVYSFINLFEKQPYLVMSSESRIKYRTVLAGEVPEFVMKFAEGWLKNNDPITAIIEMMIEDVDLNIVVRYDVDYYKVN